MRSENEENSQSGSGGALGSLIKTETETKVKAAVKTSTVILPNGYSGASTGCPVLFRERDISREHYVVDRNLKNVYH
jgi:hypothetical protein